MVLTQTLGPEAADAAQVQVCLDRAVDALLREQNPAGWWKGELRTNVTMEAEDLMMRHVLGIGDPRVSEPTAGWIRSRQGADGSWSTFPGGPGDLSTTVEAYVALRLAGDDVDREAMRRAAEFIRGAGGPDRARVFTRIWLAMLGAWSWDDLPALPPELIQLPRWFPLNVYDWASWARQTIVPLTVVSALRVTRPVGFGLPELRTHRTASTPATSPRPSSPAAAGSVTLADRVIRRGDQLLRSYHRRPWPPARRAALRRAMAWIVERQEADGGWGGIQPPWVYSIIALHAMGYPLDHPVLRGALQGLESFVVHDHVEGRPVRRLEACQSPVWDTALAVIALRETGRGGADPSVRAAVDWLLGEQIRRPGDWAVRRPGVAPGGWAFEFANDGYPDIDDTAEVVLALNGLPDAAAAVRRGMDWVLQLQCRDGGWAAFDVDNTSPWPARLPFCDFGEVTDPPSADVTAHVVEMLSRAGGNGAGRPPADASPAGPDAGPDAGTAVRRGVAWLLAAQEDDGSGFGRCGANHVYGGGAVVPALDAAGGPRDHPAVRRAVAWTVAHRNDDGGWGEDLRSYRDRRWRGRGASTPSQTAWALLALMAAGGSAEGSDSEGHDGHSADLREVAVAGRRDLERERVRAVRSGVAWLVEHQREDGWWEEEPHTGTGFPGDFFIRYDLYRMIFPITALARYRRGLDLSEAAG